MTITITGLLLIKVLACLFCLIICGAVAYFCHLALSIADTGRVPFYIILAVSCFTLVFGMYKIMTY